MKRNKRNKIKRRVLSYSLRVCLSKSKNRDKDLFLRSNDLSQLKELKKELELREVKCELDDFMQRCIDKNEFFLTPPKYVISDDGLEADFEEFLIFMDEEYKNHRFLNSEIPGRPIESIDFFTRKEIEIMKKWYK